MSYLWRKSSLKKPRLKELLPTKPGRLLIGPILAVLALAVVACGAARPRTCCARTRRPRTPGRRGRTHGSPRRGGTTGR